jgi:hypothetical protein
MTIIFDILIKETNAVEAKQTMSVLRFCLKKRLKAYKAKNL